MKVTIIQVVYNHKRFMRPVFDAIFNQTFQAFEVVVVVSGNEDGGKEFLQSNYPQVNIIDPGYNIGFAKGHNLVFSQSNSEFFQLVNPDLILKPNYLEEMLRAFEKPSVGAATGKLLRYDFDQNRALNIIDTTGVNISKSGRARDRGQHEMDNGQYDNKTELLAVSGAGPMYRKSALEAIKYSLTPAPLPEGEGLKVGGYEYFDEDFHSYWEDVDLSWRMVNAGFKCLYMPKAVGYHGRGVGSTVGGYKHVWAFVQHHKKVSSWIRQLNYKNHIFLFIKNSPRWYLQFFIREFFMLGYIVIFEIFTFKILPEFFRQLPKILAKRKWIKQHGKISVADMEKLLN